MIIHATLVETSDEWITREPESVPFIWPGEETTVSMAAAAAEKALKRAGADPSEVELLIVATISGDTVTPSTGMPGTGTDRSRQGSGI